MVDISIDEMKGFAAAYGEMKDSANDTSALDRMKSALGFVTDAVDDFKEKVKSGNFSLATLTNSLKSFDTSSLNKGLESTGEKLNDLMGNADAMVESLKKAVIQIGAIYAMGSGNFELSNQFETLGKEAEKSTASMGESFNRLFNMIPDAAKKKLGKSEKFFNNLFGQVDITRKMESSLLMNAAAAGQLDVALNSVDNNMANLSDMTLQYSRMTADVGTANALTAGQVSDYATQLMRIPGSLGKTITGLDGTKSNFLMLDAAIKVATGTAQPFEDVMKDLDMLFENFNITGRDSLLFVSRLATAVNSLNIPMKFMRKFTHDTAEQFKFLGDNSMAAIDVMSKFGPALRNSGLGPEAITQLVGHMTGAVSKMDVAQRAFVSSRTGGPGGLQGSYQVAQQLAEGDLTGVMDKVMTTMTDMFGGPIVTLKEASKDARSAAQFTKQVQMLTQGPMAIAGSDGEAYKLLDAMASGDSGKLGGLGKSPEQNLQDSVKRGNDIQDRQMNELISINNEAEKANYLLADIAAASVREYLGPGSDELQDRLERIRGIRKGAMESSVMDSGFQINRAKTGRQDEISGYAQRAENILSGFTEGIGSFVKGFDTPRGNQDLMAPDGANYAAGGYEAAPLMGGMPAQRDIDNAVKSNAKSRQGKASAQQDNLLIVQVRSDDEIKRTIKLMIDEAGNIMKEDAGKVVPGMTTK